MYWHSPQRGTVNVFVDFHTSHRKNGGEKEGQSSLAPSPHQNFWDHKSLHRVGHIFFLAVNFPCCSCCCQFPPRAIAGSCDLVRQHQRTCAGSMAVWWGGPWRQGQAEEGGGLCYPLLHQLHFQALPSFPAAPTHKEALKSFNPQDLGIQGASQSENFLVSPSLHISD